MNRTLMMMRFNKIILVKFNSYIEYSKATTSDPTTKEMIVYNLKTDDLMFRIYFDERFNEITFDEHDLNEHQKIKKYLLDIHEKIISTDINYGDPYNKDINYGLPNKCLNSHEFINILRENIRIEIIDSII